MQTFKQYLEEARSETLVYAFGRYNPPTRGHILHFQAVRDYAKKVGARYEIFVSKTVDNKKNPVPVEARIMYIQGALPDMPKPVPATNMFSIIDDYSMTQIKNVVYMAGSDYFDESADQSLFKRLQDYARGKGINLTVQMSRQREPMEEISGSALRAAALHNDYETFEKASPIGMGKIGERQVRIMFELTKRGLGAK